MDNLPIELHKLILTIDSQTLIKGCQLCKLYVDLLNYEYGLLKYNLEVTSYEKEQWVDKYETITLIGTNYSEHFQVNEGFRIVVYPEWNRYIDYTNKGMNLASMKAMAKILEPSLEIQIQLLVERGLNSEEIRVYIDRLLSSHDYVYLWQNLYHTGFIADVDEKLYDEQYVILMNRLNF